MRDIHRNPILYYLLIPVLIGIWPLLVWAVYLPRAQQDREADCRYLTDGQEHISGILEIDPQRTIIGPNRVGGEFDYGKAVDRMANLCSIPAGKHNYSAGNIITSGGKKRQDAQIKLKDVSIVQVADFLSKIQSTWVDLTCDTMKLTRVKGMPDQWNVDFRFIYYY